jgi:hypothetical protein
MSTSKKLVVLSRPAIEPELCEFIDEVLVPTLVREALRDLAGENSLAPVVPFVANFPRSDRE